MRSIIACGLVTLFLSTAPTLARADWVAEQVNEGNAAKLLFGGSDADGGIGDWYLSNGVIEAIIDKTGLQEVPAGVTPPPIQSESAPTGGFLLDLGLAGQNNDQLGEMTTGAGLLSNPIVYDSTSAFTTANSATVLVKGRVASNPELVVETEYTASGSDPFLAITTTVTNTSEQPAAGLGGLFDTFFWVLRGALPFTPLPERGFSYLPIGTAVERQVYLAAAGNLGPEDGVMDPTNGTRSGEVAYGLIGVEIGLDQDGAGGEPPRTVPVDSLLGFSNETLSALGSSPFTSTSTSALEPGGRLAYTRRVYVGNRNDIASVTNFILPELARLQSFETGTISGDVDATDTAHVSANVIATRTGGPTILGFDDGTPTTQFRTDSDGSFSNVVLPVGRYELSIRSVERDPIELPDIVVRAAENTLVAAPRMTGRGRVKLRVREHGRFGCDRNLPAKVTFIGIDGTPNPRFNKDFDAFSLRPGGPPRDLLPESYGGGPAQGNFVYLADGSESVHLRPGHYLLFASRGPEYTVARRKVEVKEGRTKKVSFEIERVVDTTGYLSADFHVHSARSWDASAPLRDRVASFAGEGVEVMVSTDHDFRLDYGPIIESLELGRRITSIVGNESTTTQGNPPVFPDNVGHLNGWPVPVLPNARRDGAIEDEYVAPNLLFSRLRSAGAEVIQYNHPRGGLGFFSKIGYDPETPVDVPPNDILLDDDVTGASGVANPDGLRNIDFDAIEVMNGTSIGGYLTVRRDWLSLLNQVNTDTGRGKVPFIAGTAVSDSHRITVESAGYGRTYVAGVGDRPAELDVSRFDARVKGGHMFGTTGPFVEFQIEDSHGARAELGETLFPETARVLLKIRVQASHWIPVEEVRVISNGDTILVFDETTKPGVKPAPGDPWSQSSSRNRVVRFEADIPLTLSKDSYLIVEAGAKLDPPPSPPEFVDMIVPGMVPLAFTNPIFVDLDGDGFDAPGLPVKPSREGSAN